MPKLAWSAAMIDVPELAGPKTDTCTRVSFSTADYPPAARLQAWREIYGQTLQKVDVEPLCDGPVFTEATMRQMPGLRMNIVRRSAMVHDRRREFVSHDDVGVTVGLTSGFEAGQPGRTLTMARGDAIVLTGAEAALLRAPSFGDYIHLRVPIRDLSPLVADLDASYGRRIPADNAALRLLSRYVGILDETDTLAAPALRQRAVAHIHDLMALAIGATGDGADAAELGGGRAARLRVVKADITDRLGDADLSVATVAARHRAQPRGIQRLFEGEGTTFTEYVLAQRLARAHRLLGDPRQAGQKISSLALDAGFGDLSYFNRAFRRRYGVAPSDVRVGAAG